MGLFDFFKSSSSSSSSRENYSSRDVRRFKSPYGIYLCARDRAMLPIKRENVNSMVNGLEDGLRRRFNNDDYTQLYNTHHWYKNEMLKIVSRAIPNGTDGFEYSQRVYDTFQAEFVQGSYKLILKECTYRDTYDSYLCICEIYYNGLRQAIIARGTDDYEFFYNCVENYVLSPYHAVHKL